MKLNIQNHLNIDEIIKAGLLGFKIGSYLTNREKLHLTSTGEGFWFRENGLYDLLDEVTDYSNYPKSFITIDTWNLTEHHPEYVINRIDQIYDCQYFSNLPELKIPNNFKLGIFLGRANYNRLLFHTNFHKIENRNDIIYTFHQNFQNNPWPSGMMRISSDGENYLKIQNSLPHSDTGKILPTPIIPPDNIFNLADEYNSIGLEIVIETVDQGFFITEKTLRPMFYGKPFIIIGSQNFEKNLAKLGFKYNFNFDFVPDQLFGSNKINFIIDVINTWYNKIDKKKWFESIMPILHHNQQILKSYALNNGKIAKDIVDSLK